jgi:short-subunit dehydrogenase
MKNSPSVQPVAVITGASRGIGAETARRLARKGYAIVASARSIVALNELSDEIAGAGGVCLAIQTDVRDSAQLRELAEKTLRRFGRVDVLIHNAGVVFPGVRLENLSPEDMDSVMATNLLAPIELTHAFLPAMKAQRSGYIGFIGSVGGHIALPSAALYSATKFGMRGFAYALRRELKECGINVCLISPGYIKTELTDPVWEIMKGYPMAMGNVDSVVAAILKSIAKPTREIVMPFYYRSFVWVDKNIPFVTDAVARFYMKKILAGYEARKASAAHGLQAEKES